MKKKPKMDDSNSIYTGDAIKRKGYYRIGEVVAFLKDLEDQEVNEVELTQLYNTFLTEDAILASPILYLARDVIRETDMSKILSAYIIIKHFVLNNLEEWLCGNIPIKLFGELPESLLLVLRILATDTKSELATAVPRRTDPAYYTALHCLYANRITMLYIQYTIGALSLNELLNGVIGYREVNQEELPNLGITI